MPDARFPIEMVSGVPVVVTPEDIDITNADGLRATLLEAARHGPRRLVIDLSRTQFCDTAGIHALVEAHKRAEAGSGEVRLVITGRAVLRIFAVTGLDNVIPHFASLEEALAVTSRGQGHAHKGGNHAQGADQGREDVSGTPRQGREQGEVGQDR
jgi:anti-sigma B factor antagonist